MLTFFPKYTFLSLLMVALLHMGLFITVSVEPTQAINLPLNNSYNEAKQRYKEAKFFYNQLLSSDAKKITRSQWERGARNFRVIYLSHRNSALAAPCLFMLGRIHNDMYAIFRNRQDLNNSISYYKDVTRLFPKSSLADDAYFKLAYITLEQNRSPKEAATYLQEVVTRYKKSNVFSQAETMLKHISSTHNITLPKKNSKEIKTSVQDDENSNSLLPIRHWTSPDYTRVVLPVSNPVSYRKTLLSHKNGKDTQLIVGLDNTHIGTKYRKKIPVSGGLLRQIRAKQTNPNTVEVVLDIASLENYKIFSLPEPFRVVIDIHGKKKRNSSQNNNVEAVKTPLPPIAISTEDTVQKKVYKQKFVILKDQKKRRIKRRRPKQKEQEPTVELEEVTKKKETEKAMVGAVVPLAKQPQKPESTVLKEEVKPHNKTEDKAKSKREKKKAKELAKVVKRQKGTMPLRQQLGLGIRKIVIDPGHGGKDPGAMGFGLKEKDIVLKLAQYLAPILEQKIGCKVRLTRAVDIFIGLEERTAIANTEKADLFISLHVNAHPSPNIRGMETYSLNLSTNAEAMRVAAMENATSTHQMSDLENILQDILKNSFATESAALAVRVQRHIITIKGHGTIHNLGVKQAPFYVLMNAQMPAILIETSFVTNKKDADNLNNPKFLKKMAEKIGCGIKEYVDAAAVN